MHLTLLSGIADPLIFMDHYAYVLIQLKLLSAQGGCRFLFFKVTVPMPFMMITGAWVGEGVFCGTLLFVEVRFGAKIFSVKSIQRKGLYTKTLLLTKSVVFMFKFFQWIKIKPKMEIFCKIFLFTISS